MDNESPLVSFIIPVLHLQRPRNKKKFFMPRSTLVELIDDIQKNVSVPYEIIIICNSRDSQLVDFVTGLTGSVKFCLNSTNVGVARSWNMGADMAEGSFLCFVNDDVRIGKDSVEKLLEYLVKNPDVGQVGPKGSVWVDCQHSHFVGIERPEEGSAISGFMFMAREDVYRKVGGFDNAYSPAGYEEIDFGFAITNLGMKNVVIPNLDIHHNEHHGVSSFSSVIHYLGKSISTEELHERNGRIFRKKWSNNGESLDFKY